MTSLHTLLLVITLASGQAPSKKLIEWGGDSPNPRQFREKARSLLTETYLSRVPRAACLPAPTWLPRTGGTPTSGLHRPTLSTA